MNVRKVRVPVLFVLGCLAVGSLPYLESANGEETATATPSGREELVESKRREVRLLDDIYKGGIVTITKHYVNDDAMIPAGTAFKMLFESAAEKGWHEVRLLDVTGEPYSDENVATDDFEKQAVTKLSDGAKWVEEIETRDGIDHLRVATPIPVVFEKCTMCHDNYSDLPAGQAIGALSYILPIEGELVRTKILSNNQVSEE